MGNSLAPLNILPPVSIGCIGMTAIDTLLFVDTLPDDHDAIRLLTSRAICLGGKGMITALTLFELGCKTCLFTLVGANALTADSAFSYLPPNFDTTFLMPWLNKTSRTWLTISKSQSVHTVVDLGRLQNISPIDLTEGVKTFIAKCDVLYLSCEDPVLLREVIANTDFGAVKVVTNLSHALIVTLAPHDLDLLDSLVHKSHIVLMNHAESEVILKLMDKSRWFSLDDDGPQEVVITNGKHGGIAGSRSSMAWISFPRENVAEVRCVVGAGDTFNAAFVQARVVAEGDLESSCRYAALVAANKVQVAGSSSIIVSTGNF